MSFIFDDKTFEDNSFNEEIRNKLNHALRRHQQSADPRSDYQNIKESKNLSSGILNCKSESSTEVSKSSFSKIDILKSRITVTNVKFSSTPKLEILDLDVSTQAKSLIKGICKVSCKDAMVQIKTEIEANLLLLHTSSSPKFITPRFISNDSFTVPITMTFDKIDLEAIANIFVKNTGVGISFNDVNLDFQFRCSIKLLQSSIEKRLKASMEAVFKDVLPSVIFNMSQRWFTDGETAASLPDVPDHVSEVIHQPKTILDDSDLTDLSPANMLRLSSIVSSRQTLCLNSSSGKIMSTIPCCLERQNLHHFNLRIPSLNNYYREKPNDTPAANTPTTVNPGCWPTSISVLSQSTTKIENTLPSHVLKNNTYDLKTIASIQARIFERTVDETTLRRRKIRINKKRIPLQETESPVPLSPTSLPKNSNIIISTGLDKSALCEEEPELDADVKHSAFVDKPCTQQPKTVEFHELYSLLYSSASNSKFCVIPCSSPDIIKEPTALLLDSAKRFGFVGLINNYTGKWGNDPPPPYRESSI